MPVKTLVLGQGDEPAQPDDRILRRPVFHGGKTLRETSLWHQVVAGEQANKPTPGLTDAVVEGRGFASPGICGTSAGSRDRSPCLTRWHGSNRLNRHRQRSLQSLAPIARGCSQGRSLQIFPRSSPIALRIRQDPLRNAISVGIRFPLREFFSSCIKEILPFVINQRRSGNPAVLSLSGQRARYRPNLLPRCPQ